MGTYINKGNEGFRRALNSVYVDKTGMISVINETLNTERSYTCLTRCRRFGKTMAANMLCAYYDKSCDSRSLFDGLYISQPDKMVGGKMENKQFEKHLNKYPVISLDITSFTTKYGNDKNIISYLQEDIITELLSVFPDVKRGERDDLMDVLIKIVNITGEKFIMIIDEWDAICREYGDKPEIMDAYVNLLRRMFKNSSSVDVFAGVYMTGILPIKKYKTQSALNNFREYSMTDPKTLASFFGFTEKEVEALADESSVDINDLKKWYDGYSIGREKSIYNPYSVIEALYSGECKNYWQTTGAYDSVRTYIQSNFDGLKDDIIKMLAGGCVSVNTTRFQNDMHIINSKDDVLTVLIHLGYLSYDSANRRCYIPNLEVAEEMTNAVEDSCWTEVSKTLQNSENLLDATIAGNETAVAKAIDIAHDDNTSILSYNDENSLSCVLSIAYIWAKNEYVIHRELATGKGFADLVLIPRKNVDKPALVIELKYDKTVNTALDQIKQKNYPAKILDYTGNILLVGINYNKETKLHSCKIEEFVK